MVFGGILAIGWVRFSQFSYCVGGKVFGYCIGYLYNYTWLVGVGLLAIGLLLVVIRR